MVVTPPAIVVAVLASLAGLSFAQTQPGAKLGDRLGIVNPRSGYLEVFADRPAQPAGNLLPGKLEEVRLRFTIGNRFAAARRVEWAMRDEGSTARGVLDHGSLVLRGGEWQTLVARSQVICKAGHPQRMSIALVGTQTSLARWFSCRPLSR